MIATTSGTFDLLRLNAVRDVLRSSGPCITLMLPPYRPGDTAGPLSTLIKAEMRCAARQLAERGVTKPAAEQLLEPIVKLDEDAAGSHWSRVIFRSPNVFEQFLLRQPVKTARAIGECFSIRPLLTELALPDLFYVLALSKERVGLLRCSGVRAEPANLPGSAPQTLTDWLAIEPPDHTLLNRSSAGPSTGAMAGVRFGTGGQREKERAYLSDFYKSIDRGVHEMLRESETPVILAGVDEDIAVYRAANTYPRLIRKCISGSLDVGRDQTSTLRVAYSILQADVLERQATSLKIAKERSGAGRFSTDLDAILNAAFDGRVERLGISESAERTDVFERGDYRSLGKEDLFNLAAVQTILHNGKACSLPPELMPDKSVAAAILRF